MSWTAIDITAATVWPDVLISGLYLTDDDGVYLTDDDGAFLYVAEESSAWAPITVATTTVWTEVVT